MRIKRIEPIAVSVPMVKPVKMSFEIVSAANNALVRLETDDGIVGWGEASSAPVMTGDTQGGIMAGLNYLAPLLEGMPADDIDAVMAKADRHLYGNRGAKSGIEMALWDALGKARGKPAAELLGGRRRVRVALLRLVGTGSAAGDVEEVRRCRDEGYVAFKVKVGVSDPHMDAERTREVCDALQEADVLICADANQGWSVADATAYVKAVEDTPIAFFEQPVAADDLEGMAKVAHASQVKIGFDEGLHSIADLQRHHDAGAAHGVSLKTIKLGGMKPVMEAALLAQQLGMEVNLACKMCETGIATAAVLQLAAAVPSVAWGVSLTNQYLADDVLAEPLPIADGHAEAPSGPGLGITVDEEKIARYRVER